MKKIKKSLIGALSVCVVMMMLVQVSLAAGRQLIPVGDVVGISLATDGVLVVGYPDEQTSAAKTAGIRPGDVIIKIGDVAVKSGADLEKYTLTASPVEITVMRGGEEKKITVTPSVGNNGNFELGMWLRDGITGIGTVTFYDPESGMFGALGHGINDADTKSLLPVGEGILFEADVTAVIEGKCGFPGQLSGVFDFSEIVGIVSKNTVCGIFGTVTDSDMAEGMVMTETAEAGEIHEGKAVIISCVDENGPCEYDVEIVKVDLNDREGHNFVVKITDETLLSKTGGIVQGMSGSPIIQDGKLLGAVTHVFINDPTTGYGIYIEKMLEAAS